MHTARHVARRARWRRRWPEGAAPYGRGAATTTHSVRQRLHRNKKQKAEESDGLHCCCHWWPSRRRTWYFHGVAAAQWRMISHGASSRSCACMSSAVCLTTHTKCGYRCWPASSCVLACGRCVRGGGAAARRHRDGASPALPSACESHGSPVQTLTSLHWRPGIGRRHQCSRAWPVAGNGSPASVLSSLAGGREYAGRGCQRHWPALAATTCDGDQRRAASLRPWLPRR